MAEEENRGMWLRDWSADVSSRVTPWRPPAIRRSLLTIRPPLGPATRPVLASRRFAPSLARTILTRPPLVLRNVTAGRERDRASLLTVQSPLPGALAAQEMVPQETEVRSVDPGAALEPESTAAFATRPEDLGRPARPD